MSVYVSQRGEAKAKFVQLAYAMRRDIIMLIKKFPKSYRYTNTNYVLELAFKICDNCMSANAIYIGKSADLSDIKLRKKWMVKALAKSNTLSGEMTMLYEILLRGDNFLTPDKRDKAFEKIATELYDLSNQLKKLIRSDKELKRRYKLNAK